MEAIKAQCNPRDYASVVDRLRWSTIVDRHGRSFEIVCLSAPTEVWESPSLSSTLPVTKTYAFMRQYIRLNGVDSVDCWICHELGLARLVNEVGGPIWTKDERGWLEIP